MQTIDLFCGCGGLTAGFRAAGFENLVGFDNWQAALDTYSANNPDQGEIRLRGLPSTKALTA